MLAATALGYKDAAMGYFLPWTYWLDFSLL